MACTVLRVQNADVTERFYPGLTLLRVEPRGDQVAVVSTRGWGLTVASQHASIGYLKEVSIAASDPTKCRLVVIIQTLEEAETFRRLLETVEASGDRFCLLQP